VGRPIRHVVVEGVDGSGKDTLIRTLAKIAPPPYPEFPHFSIHPRACTSTGGPVSNLADWVDEDMKYIENMTPSIYNRHPLISEPIYGPLIRGYLPSGFNNRKWVDSRTEKLASHCLVIFCDPGLDLVRERIKMDPQMPKVVDNLDKLYELYQIDALNWNGPKLYYNSNHLTPQHVVDYIIIQAKLGY
jgi:energy-coupling factor transporter ATP-binding protein EcfA2